jgi:hypothetical protein
MTNECEVLAGRLSKAQREWLLHRSSGAHFWGGSDSDSLPSWQAIGHDLKAVGIIAFVSETSSATRLTPLGEQLQAYIRGQEPPQ